MSETIQLPVFALNEALPGLSNPKGVIEQQGFAVYTLGTVNGSAFIHLAFRPNLSAVPLR